MTKTSIFLHLQEVITQLSDADYFENMQCLQIKDLTPFRQGHLGSTLLLSTPCQLFHMSNEDTEQLATFMRHSSSIHRSNYRLSNDIFQTTKITKLLLMMEKGEGAQYKDRPLDEIDIPLEDNLITNCRNATNFSDSSDSENEYPEDIPLHDILSGTSRNAGSREDNVITMPELSEDVLQLCKDKKTGTKNKVTKKDVHKWTNEQRKVVGEFFKTHTKEKILPKRHEVEQLYELYPQIKLPEKWSSIKVFVQNIYTQKTDVARKRIGLKNRPVLAT